MLKVCLKDSVNYGVYAMMRSTRLVRFKKKNLSQVNSQSEDLQRLWIKAVKVAVLSRIFVCL
jgi:hypothetical protein